MFVPQYVVETLNEKITRPWNEDPVIALL